MIYVIQAGKNGPVKIGQTSGEIKDRISQLQTGCPYELKLVWLFPKGTIEAEAQAHKDLEAERIRGEWFKPSLEVFNYIEQHFRVMVKCLGDLSIYVGIHTVEVTEGGVGSVVIDRTDNFETRKVF